MNPQQILGIVLIILAVGLIGWTLWPVKKQDKQPVEPVPPDETDGDFEAVAEWADIHAAIAELHILLSGNDVARAKLNELGASLYDVKNWSQPDESVE
jgi:hypothetical protein